MTWKNLSFWVRLTNFKHTGVFPEQVLQWEWMQKKISSRLHSNNKKGVAVVGNPHRVPAMNMRTSDGGNNRHEPDSGQALQQTQDKNSKQSQTARTTNGVNVLNLFAYTGIASIVCAKAGAKVTHVDASKPSLAHARENQNLSGLKDKSIRWILDDCLKFVEREIRRCNTYDAIIMDPPVFGHGATGEVWKFNESFPRLMESCSKILSSEPLFIIVNAYAISSSSIMLENVMRDFLPKGQIEIGELCLEETLGKRLLSTGIYARLS